MSDSFPHRSQDSLVVHTSILCGLVDRQETSFDEAYLRFVERYYLHMLNWFRRFPHLKPQDCEDAVQDFFLSIRRKIRSDRSQDLLRRFAADTLDGKLKFKKWLWRVAKHASVDFLRTRKNRSLLTENEGADLQNRMSEQIEMLLRDDFDMMLTSVKQQVIGLSLGASGRISENDWNIFVRRYHCTNDELAEHFKKTVRAVEQSIYRVNCGLKMIQQSLIQQYGTMSQFMLADEQLTNG